jgi:hypothetical protein
MLIANQTTLVIAAASLLGIAASAQSAQADFKHFTMDIAYSATRVIEGGEQRMEQRYFQRDATTNRMEMHLHGQHSTIIMNGDRGVMWILMPSQNMYMESSIDDQPFDGANVELPDPETWEMERVGREPVNGVPATKYRVATDSGEKTRMRGFLWISDDGIPVRTDMVTGGDRIQMELRDLVVGPQPAELFEPPAGYQRIALGDDMNSGMGDLMRGAMGGATTAPAQAGGADAGFVGELATEATDEVKRATKDEVRGTVNDAVRKGLRGILRGP